MSEVSDILFKLVAEFAVPVLETVLKLAFVVLAGVYVETVFGVSAVLDHADIDTPSDIFLPFLTDPQISINFEANLLSITEFLNPSAKKQLFVKPIIANKLTSIDSKIVFIVIDIN